FLPERIQKILHGIYPQKISRLRMVCATGVCAILSIPLAAGTLTRAHLMTVVLPPPLASPAVQPVPEKVEEVAPAAPRRVVAEAPQIPAPPPSQPSVAVIPKFEVASVKPCEIGGGQRGVPGGGRGGGPGIPIVSPGRLNLVCQTVKQLIQQAYLTYAGAKQNN